MDTLAALALYDSRFRPDPPAPTFTAVPAGKSSELRLSLRRQLAELHAIHSAELERVRAQALEIISELRSALARERETVSRLSTTLHRERSGGA